MSDIFISYAREDKSRVETLAKALQDSGWSVWWDPHIPTGKRFDEVIEQAISAAGCIIVVWSKNSVSSTFVRAEASEGADRQILLPVMIDEVKIPLAFRQIQTARLVDWQGSTQDPEFVKLVNDISTLAGKESKLPPTTVTHPNVRSVSTVESDSSAGIHSWFCSEPPGLLQRQVASLPTPERRQLTPVPSTARPSVSLPTGRYRVQFFFKGLGRDLLQTVDSVSIAVR